MHNAQYNALCLGSLEGYSMNTTIYSPSLLKNENSLCVFNVHGCAHGEQADAAREALEAIELQPAPVSEPVQCTRLYRAVPVMDSSATLRC